MTTRTLTSHYAEPADRGFGMVIAADVADPDKGHHRYLIMADPFLGADFSKNPSFETGTSLGMCQTILFQNGPVAEGYNGTTNEALLAIVADRLESFQKGKFACQENAEALVSVEQALTALKPRTLRRRSQGTEGTDVETPAAAPAAPTEKKPLSEGEILEQALNQLQETFKLIGRRIEDKLKDLGKKV